MNFNNIPQETLQLLHSDLQEEWEKLVEQKRQIHINYSAYATSIEECHELAIVENLMFDCNFRLELCERLRISLNFNYTL